MNSLISGDDFESCQTNGVDFLVGPGKSPQHVGGLFWLLPLDLDLLLLAAVNTRIQVKAEGEVPFPLRTPEVNSLSKQHAMFENILRACM
ncbi:hypothetical protein CUMW_234080, partial [Citrus unshiu]